MYNKKSPEYYDKVSRGRDHSDTSRTSNVYELRLTLRTEDKWALGVRRNLGFVHKCRQEGLPGVGNVPSRVPNKVNHVGIPLSGVPTRSLKWEGGRRLNVYPGPTREWRQNGTGPLS